ncbi:hypothetical protein SBI_08944 [Streptomyces bingchenggensis BCW-1]|uniref:Uncharacterized protein n=1 Tax=Streptomyces bingchenggensis (strain BCW-1) TaxID=749414 RepID=D7C022_STRBB|nr:hypothetical protein SBI_08944 [Streptomyces bingchenggensis BCW-1]
MLFAAVPAVAFAAVLFVAAAVFCRAVVFCRVAVFVLSEAPRLRVVVGVLTDLTSTHG